MQRKHDGLIVDLGNVIIAYWLSDITPENFHTIDYNAIPEVPGALESLKRLNERFGGGRDPGKPSGQAPERLPIPSGNNVAACSDLLRPRREVLPERVDLVLASAPLQPFFGEQHVVEPGCAVHRLGE